MVSVVLAVAAPAILAWGGLRPAKLVEKTVDSGTFAITVGGRRAGRETFEIVQSGLSMEVRTRSTVDLPTGQTTIRGALRVDPDWKPRSGTFDTILRSGSTRTTLQQRGTAVESATMMPGRRVSFTRPPGDAGSVHCHRALRRIAGPVNGVRPAHQTAFRPFPPFESLQARVA